MSRNVCWALPSSMRRFATGLLFFACVASVRIARAAPPQGDHARRGYGSGAFLAGWGTSFAGRSSERRTGNLYDVGYGLRGGYTLDVGVYLGAVLVNHVGDAARPTVNSDFCGEHVSEGSAEVGYDIGDRYILRPYAALGVGLWSYCDRSVRTRARVDVGPGLLAFARFGRAIVGIDARLSYLPDPGESRISGAGAYLLVGFAFGGDR